MLKTVQLSKHMNVRTDEGRALISTLTSKSEILRISQQSCSVLKQRDGLKSSAKHPMLLNRAGGSMRHWNLQNGSARDTIKWWKNMKKCYRKTQEAICLHREGVSSQHINASFQNRSSGKPTLTDIGSRTLQGVNSDMFLQLPWHSTLLKWNGFKWYKNAQNNLPLNRRCKRLPVGSRQVGDLEFVTLASKFTSPSVVPHIQHGTSTSIFLPIKDAMQRWGLKLSSVQNLYQLLPAWCFFWTCQFKSVLLHQKVQTALQLLSKNI